MSPFTLDGASFSRPQSTVSSPNFFHDQTSPTPHGPDQSKRRNTSNRVQHTISSRKTASPEPVSLPIRTQVEPIPPPYPESIPQEECSPWSSAVGRATLGKSGRVIERLMADIDRLKRELNAEISHRQEVEKREETSRSQIAVMKAEITNLLQGKDIDAAALKRRDRKIEELRGELEGERTRRVAAQSAAREAIQQRDEVVEQSNRAVAEAEDLARRAESHAEVLEQSHRELKRDYGEQTDTLSNELHTLMEDREDESQRAKKLDVVVEQMRHELDRANRVNEQMARTFSQYKEISEERLRNVQQEKESWSASERALRQETERVLKEAKWLLNVGKVATAREGLLSVS